MSTSPIQWIAAAHWLCCIHSVPSNSSVFRTVTRDTLDFSTCLERSKLYSAFWPLLAHERDVSNHVYGEVEQQLAAVIIRDGRRCVAIPNQSRHRLRFLTPTLRGGWDSVAPDAVFEHPIHNLRWVEGNRLQVQFGTQYRSLR